MQCNSSFRQTHTRTHVNDLPVKEGFASGFQGTGKWEMESFERTRPPPKRPINRSSMRKKSDPMADGWSQKANVNTINHRFDSLSACFSICAFDYVTHTLAHPYIHPPHNHSHTHAGASIDTLTTNCL